MKQSMISLGISGEEKRTKLFIGLCSEKCDSITGTHIDNSHQWLYWSKVEEPS